MLPNVNIPLGARVEGANGEELGRVHLLEADQYTNEIKQLIVEANFAGTRKIVVDADRVKEVSADGKLIRLEMTPDQLSQLPDFTGQEPNEFGSSPASI